MNGPRRAVFVDRDGTLIHDRHYLADPDGVELLPRTVEGLRRVADAGFSIVVVTNQSGVGRGFISAEAVTDQHERLRLLLADEGIEIAGFYVCPHAPDAGCDCRKPLPGLLLRAAEELELDLSTSWTVGDKERDVEAGRLAGTRTIRIGDDCTDLAAAAVQITSEP